MSEREFHTAEWYAQDFAKQLQLNDKVERKCEYSCLLWSKDHWTTQAKNAQIAFLQTKSNLSESSQNEKALHELFSDSQFLNTISQTYSKLFGHREQLCGVKRFAECPFMVEREELLKLGGLAAIFATILHKATLYAMLDRHPLDSGLIHEEFEDVYEVDMTDFLDLEKALSDGRFAKLYENVVRRAIQMAGTPQQPRICSPGSSRSESA